MSHTVFRPGELDFQALDPANPERSVARLSDFLTSSRANIWRLPPGARNRRHVEHAQEEMFVVLEGEATLLLGDPPERVGLPRGSIAVVPTDTPLQLRNESEDEALVLIVGAPPVAGQAAYLPETD